MPTVDALDEIEDVLGDIIRKVFLLRSRLRHQGRFGDAKEMTKRLEDLFAASDAIIGERVASLLASDADEIVTLQRLSRRIQRNVKAMKDKADVVDAVVRALGLIDDAIVLIGKFAG